MKRTTAQRKRDAAPAARGPGGHRVIQGELDGKKLKIAVVTARFNSDITYRLEAGALRTLQRLGVAAKDVTVARVPGAVEIVTAAKALLKSGADAVIALACVIRGETTHYESVCTAVERGCTHLQLETGRPVVFGVLTVENLEQALDRVGGHHGHKGEEAAECAVEMANLLKALRGKRS